MVPKQGQPEPLPNKKKSLCCQTLQRAVDCCLPAQCRNPSHMLGTPQGNKMRTMLQRDKLWHVTPQGDEALMMSQGVAALLTAQGD